MPQERISKAEYDALKELQETKGLPPGLLPGGASETCNLAAIGGAYELGALVLSPATLETFALLNAIDSPFLKEGIAEADITLDTVAQAVCVFASPPETLRPLMAIAQRLEALKQTENLAEKAPGFYNVYLEKLDQLTKVRANFKADAMAVYAQAGNVTLEQSVLVIMQILRDAMDGFGMLPDEPEDAKKKKTESLT